MNAAERERYSRQVLFAGIGEAGQEKLLASRVAIVGCGALGTQQASLLVRAGIGELLLIDRDFVEESNLQRQTLFSEPDAAEHLPKAVAAEQALRRANSGVNVRGAVTDLTADNIKALLGSVQLILDGTDNFGTRYLLNDFSVQSGIPWIYGAAVGSTGMSMTVRPGHTPCVACVFPEPPGGLQATCDTAGVIGPAAAAVVSIQVAETLKLLTGNLAALHGKLISFDLWENRFQALDAGAPAENCRACRRREFTYLHGRRSSPVVLCGRDSVQVQGGEQPLNFAELESKLKPLGSVRYNAYVLRFATPPYDMTVFPDGRAIIKGTDDVGLARSLYARYIGM